jgi:hypothetical protein
MATPSESNVSDLATQMTGQMKQSGMSQADMMRAMFKAQFNLKELPANSGPSIAEHGRVAQLTQNIQQPTTDRNSDVKTISSILDFASSHNRAKGVHEELSNEFNNNINALIQNTDQQRSKLVKDVQALRKELISITPEIAAKLTKGDKAGATQLLNEPIAKRNAQQKQFEDVIKPAEKSLAASVAIFFKKTRETIHSLNVSLPDTIKLKH